jgi:hypothetical protein
MPGCQPGRVWKSDEGIRSSMCRSIVQAEPILGGHHHEYRLDCCLIQVLRSTADSRPSNGVLRVVASLQSGLPGAAR